MRPMPLVQLENTDWSSSSDLAFYLGNETPPTATRKTFCDIEI